MMNGMPGCIGIMGTGGGIGIGIGKATGTGGGYGIGGGIGSNMGTGPRGGLKDGVIECQFVLLGAGADETYVNKSAWWFHNM